MKNTVKYVTKEGNEYSPEETIQLLLNKISKLESRVAELSDVVNRLISRLPSDDVADRW